MVSAGHTTTLMMTGATCGVREAPEQVIERIRDSITRGDGWFQATADPEGEPIWINAARLPYVGRERTPFERVMRKRYLRHVRVSATI